ncbi:phosphatase PAP2 family protein [Actinophytocola gossypii]|uniref:Phosphatase PAP2 family protein n=1 Tax=Actinophytocola gossypii TaxID=2812003 RepID=A0ABT2J786_9PSEU|nr:phosphatase PAP2 family protein [Actinophytocola gossypii]MCT2583715.1 phosphatase PAP2 family protein [Actinophytocola gossypii]
MAPSDRQAVHLALVGLLFAAAVALTAFAHDVTDLDTAVRQWALGHRAAGLTTAATVVTTIGGSLVLAPVAVAVALVLAVRGRRSDALLVSATTLGALVLGPLLKAVIERPRPREDHLVVVDSFAYPSGHSLTSMAVLGVLTALAVRHLTVRAARATAVAAGAFLIAAVGVSRVYLGVHWPTDVLAGWLVGATWLTVCLIVVGRRVKQDVK